MDSELKRRWLAGTAPFDGAVLMLDDLIPKETGYEVLPWLLERLDAAVGLAETLNVNEDRHCRDGFIKTSFPMARDTLISELQSGSPRWFSVLDSGVSRGIYDDGFRYWLRFACDDEEPRMLDFDLTSTQAVVTEIAAGLDQVFQIAVEVRPAKAFFDRKYGG